MYPPPPPPPPPSPPPLHADLQLQLKLQLQIHFRGRIFDIKSNQSPPPIREPHREYIIYYMYSTYRAST